jgi:hypothetical protein
MPAERFRDLRLDEGDTLVVRASRARVFLASADGN